jgi:hypothetical protein
MDSGFETSVTGTGNGGGTDEKRVERPARAANKVSDVVLAKMLAQERKHQSTRNKPGVGGGGGGGVGRTPTSRFRSDQSSRRSSVANDDTNLFDIYELSFTNMQVLLSTRMTPYANVRSNVAPVGLFDPVSLKVGVHVSLLPYDRTLAQLKLFAQLPAFHVNLSQDTLETLVKFASAFGSQPRSSTAQGTCVCHWNWPLGSRKTLA